MQSAITIGGLCLVALFAAGCAGGATEEPLDEQAAEPREEAEDEPAPETKEALEATSLNAYFTSLNAYFTK